MLHEFIELLKNHIENKRLSRADLDELIALAEVEHAQVPERAKILLTQCDQEFGNDIAARMEYLERILRICLVAQIHTPPSARRAAKDTLPIAPIFTLGSEHRSRAAQLCQEARERVFGVEYFDIPHRRRLLDRIAAIEAEIAQPFGFYDVLRGGMNDLDEALAAFRQQNVPLRGILAELVTLARNGCNDYSQLPMPDARPTEARSAPKHAVPFS